MSMQQVVWRASAHDSVMCVFTFSKRRWRDLCWKCMEQSIGSKLAMKQTSSWLGFGGILSQGFLRRAELLFLAGRLAAIHSAVCASGSQAGWHA
mmetsp:Transcript_19513/g.43364  ORF Transcript_19513/g.43364 Transcript_19513/m.43364 type:complete len:94 (+) Transcript_19513:2712-2993(+)